MSEGEVKEVVEAEGEDAGEAEVGEAVLVDQSCFLCVALPDHVPEESKLKREIGLTDKELHYAHGFADGVSSMIRGHGWHYCQRHLKILRVALLDRGVNWSPEPERGTRRVIA